MSNEHIIETLNDLVQINNDRITGYEKALKELKEEDYDLKPTFLKFIQQSHELKSALGTEIQVLKGSIDAGTTTSGKLYRMWMDVKAAFTGHDDQTVLNNAEFGEDAAQKAYKNALQDEDLPANIHNLIQSQQIELKKAHDEVKSLRDAHVDVK
jgi:uncharacterized protein (TIGR02284 family)